MAEPFAAALRRYIRSGYRAPEAMKAVWHDVKLGRVERPRRPGRRYRHGAAALPRRGAPLLNPRSNVTAARMPKLVKAFRGRDGTWTVRGQFAPGGRWVTLVTLGSIAEVAEWLRSRGINPRRVTRPMTTGNPLARWETARVLRAARGAARLAATERPGTLARGFWTGKAERGFEIADVFGAPGRRPEVRRWRAADPLRRTRPNPDGTERLADAAAQIAMRAAAEYLRRHGLEADPEALASTLRAWLKIKLPEALRDARQALEAGMGKVAEQTFAASMALAGIEAAKEAGFPKGARRNPRLYQLLPGGRDVDLGRFPTYKRAAAHARAAQRKHGGEFLIRGRRGRRTEERYVGPRTNPVGRRLRVIPSHSGHARFMREVEGPIGSIPREVHTPYAYGPTHTVWSWRGVPVIIAETRHKRYEVFRVEGPLGPVDNPRQRRRALSIPEQHQLRIARQTLRMPAPMVGVMGGPSKREARRILRRLRGNPTMVPTEALRPGDVILPPARELALWMRRHIRERGLPESALKLTVVSVREGTPDKRGPWLIVTTRQSEAWLAGRPGHPFTFKARPATPWPLLRSGARANPRPRRRAGEREPEYSAARGHVRSLLNEEYWQAMRRAEYYRWAAGKPFVGRDPLTGRQMRGWPVHERAERECNKAQARVWLGQAKHLRGRMGREVLPNPRRPSRARFCPERVADPRAFDRRSFRTVIRRGHRITVGCPRGQYDARRRRCRVGTRAQRVLHPEGEGRCPIRRERGNPTAAACALCRLEPRAPMSPYCRKCLRLFQRPPRRARPNPMVSVYTPGAASITWDGRREVLAAERRNPPRGGTVIYDRLREVRADKGRRSHFPRQPFKHRVTSAAKVIGLPDGSVLLRGPRPLWQRVEV